jgi:HSP20 family protein
VSSLAWKLLSFMARNAGGAASVLAHCPAHPVKVRQSKEKTMTQLVPESWQQTLGHLRANIHGAINRWWHRPAPAVGSAQIEVMYRAGTFRLPSLPLRETPGFNVGETDDALIVTTDVPELKLDDYTVEILDERLVVRGEQKQSSERDGQDDDAERSYSAFMRILPLPRAVDVEHAQARYQNGVLRVTLPKTAQAKARRVKVQVRG